MKKARESAGEKFPMTCVVKNGVPISEQEMYITAMDRFQYRILWVQGILER